ncbi:hypothetical protein [Agrobacterium tumefaciens]|jgi:maleate cis-trans isomerase|uniref:hypothetical protein n=1 Tax=Agrobacterium tumefaciens TaxID=358 RepID=UPI0001FC5765|nr:hypothetical protein [Agrobacterium tumefaciens]ADY64414.1 hypothetical protein AGROH133_06155 [Agrobacterium tumefaciens]MEA1840750.1 hypothetical protein [Agrobacterium tumefaciens]
MVNNVLSANAEGMPDFPNLEAEVCDVFNSTRIALDYITAQLVAHMDHDDANTAAYILHDAATRAEILKNKFYAAMDAHHAAKRR